MLDLYHNEKIVRLRKLEREGIVTEECPVPDHDNGGVKYWRFSVQQPDALSPDFALEYRKLGEIRW